MLPITTSHFGACSAFVLCLSGSYPLQCYSICTISSTYLLLFLLSLCLNLQIPLPFPSPLHFTEKWLGVKHSLNGLDWLSPIPPSPVDLHGMFSSGLSSTSAPQTDPSELIFNRLSQLENQLKELQAVVALPRGPTSTHKHFSSSFQHHLKKHHNLSSLPLHHQVLRVILSSDGDEDHPLPNFLSVQPCRRNLG